MGGFATAPLASAVTLAGGLGHIGAGPDLSTMDAELASVEKACGRHNGLLPIGVGFLPFINKLPEVLDLVSRHKPAVVWLFATEKLEDYAIWAVKMREANPEGMVWVQVGSVAAAIQVAKEARPDVLCIQGLDAGGHGFEKGAGIISLLPEVHDALSSAGLGHIPLVAAGGIVDGRGAAAALALGAEGVVLGTRFLAAHETNVHPLYQDAVIAAGDGGQTTVRAKLFDELKGPNPWPGEYDGRSIVSESWTDHTAGVGIEEIRRLHQAAAEDRGKAGFGLHGGGRAAMWAGTGVGLVREKQGAGEIVEEVRRGSWRRWRGCGRGCKVMS